MKSDICSEVGIDRYYIECTCYGPGHLLVFDIDKDQQWCAVSVVSDWKLGFWKRLHLAFRYVFTRNPFVYSDTVGISLTSYTELEEIVQKIKAACIKTSYKSQAQRIEELLIELKNKASLKSLPIKKHAKLKIRNYK